MFHVKHMASAGGQADLFFLFSFTLANLFGGAERKKEDTMTTTKIYN